MGVMGVGCCGTAAAGWSSLAGAPAGALLPGVKLGRTAVDMAPGCGPSALCASGAGCGGGCWGRPAGTAPMVVVAAAAPMAKMLVPPGAVLLLLVPLKEAGDGCVGICGLLFATTLAPGTWPLEG